MNEVDQLVFGLTRQRNLKRWIPATDFPFDPYMFFMRIKSGFLLKGSFFSMCSSAQVKSGIGYIQLAGNKLSGELTLEISKLHYLGMLYLDHNDLYGELPPDIGSVPLVALNISKNMFSGEIPKEIGMLKCLQNLDLSCNNFSGEVPKSMFSLYELSRFNISYNPYLSGKIPSIGQLATFERSSFLGNPLLELPNYLKEENGSRSSRTHVLGKAKGDQDELLDWFFMAFIPSYPIFAILSFVGFLFFGSEKISPFVTKKWLKRRRMQIL